ncbi:hypothetical protein [Huintestinicola sp.]|uniref:hypothetical protein n=1 Tax=Huintestinicola sp. TaxID=2981661 RepID=UPI003D7D1CF5
MNIYSTAYWRLPSGKIFGEPRVVEVRFKGQNRAKNGRFDFDDSIRKNKKCKKSLTKNHNGVKLDKKGHSFKYQQCAVSNIEYACFIRNVNTFYKERYSKKKWCKYYSGELDIMFYFENHGFDDYCIYRKG